METEKQQGNQTRLMMMNLTLFAALLFLPLFFILAKRRQRRSNEQKKHLPPSPRGLPFIGNLLQLGMLPHHSLSHLAKRYGPLMLLHIGSIPTLIVSSPHFAQEFLKTHDLVFASRPLIKASKVLMYNSIDVAFSPYGECWRQMKKISMIHLLSPKMVQTFNYIRVEEVDRLISRIAAHNGSVICLTKMLIEVSNNVLCRTVLGSSLNEEKMRLVCTLVRGNSILFSDVFVEDIFPRFRVLDMILGLEKKLNNHFKTWDAIFDEFIDSHMINKSEDHSNATFLGVLLQLQKDSNMDFPLTKEHIKAALMDMMVAGTDTSFVTLDWSMVELSRNPKVMKKVKDEVRRYSNGCGIITEEDLPKMSYLKAVIKEVLRLHPPAPLLLPRESIQDCQIQGYDIPNRTRVIINAWAIGRDKSYWEAPDEFIPERFMGSDVDIKGKHFQFIPFGAGRRICPGISFATSFIELTLANLLYHFDWNLPDGFSISNMNMEECHGLVTMRKQKLELVPMLAKKVT